MRWTIRFTEGTGPRAWQQKTRMIAIAGSPSNDGSLRPTIVLEVGVGNQGNSATASYLRGIAMERDPRAETEPLGLCAAW